MNEAAAFGNTEWYVYVLAAYIIVGAVLVGYALYALKARQKALASLKNEGFLSDDSSGRGDTQ